MGTTATFLKSRVSKPTLGKWSSGFTACKKYADDNKVPLIAVWSNGDACGHCTNFEKTVMGSTFTKWMATSKCVFWFGCSSDKTVDDKYQGTGFNWARNSKLTLYPFVRVWWQAGKVDVAKSGSSWTGGTAKGWTTFITNLKSALKNYKPDEAPAENKPVDEDECGEGGCGDCGDCGDCGNKLADACDKAAEASAKIETAIAALQDAAKTLAELKSNCHV